jgi:hypothetical protein
MDEQKQKTFTISIECEATLNVEDSWPDGDAPENPTAKDVIQAMDDDCGSVTKLLDEWNLPAEVFVWDANDHTDKATWH